jgi:hypothetical protein
MLATLLRIYFLWAGLRQVQRAIFGGRLAPRRRASSSSSNGRRRLPVAELEIAQARRPATVKVKAARRQPTRIKRPAKRITVAKTTRKRRKK